jgi:hypothetical protein
MCGSGRIWNAAVAVAVAAAAPDSIAEASEHTCIGYLQLLDAIQRP